MPGREPGQRAHGERITARYPVAIPAVVRQIGEERYRMWLFYLAVVSLALGDGGACIFQTVATRHIKKEPHVTTVRPNDGDLPDLAGNPAPPRPRRRRRLRRVVAALGVLLLISAAGVVVFVRSTPFGASPSATVLSARPISSASVAPTPGGS